MQTEMNARKDRVKELCNSSSHNAAKWIKDNETGNVYYWPSDQATHAEMAESFKITNYTKGIATPD